MVDFLRTFGFCRNIADSHPDSHFCNEAEDFFTSSHSEWRFLGGPLVGPLEWSQRYKPQSVKSERSNIDRPTTQPCFPTCMSSDYDWVCPTCQLRERLSPTLQETRR